MKIMRLDPTLDQRAHQALQALRRIVDAAEQHALRQHGNADVNQARASGTRFRRKFTGVVAMKKNINRRPSAQRFDQFRRDARGIDDRHAGMDAQHFDVIDLIEPGYGRGKSPIGQHQRIAAGENDFPNLGMFPDIIQRPIERVSRQHSARLTDLFAPKAKSTIDRACEQKFQKHPVGITMDDAFDRRVAVVPDRIDAFFGKYRKFVNGRHELRGNGIVSIRGIDQRKHRWCNRYRELRRDGLKLRSRGG